MVVPDILGQFLLLSFIYSGISISKLILSRFHAEA